MPLDGGARIAGIPSIVAGAILLLLLGSLAALLAFHVRLRRSNDAVAESERLFRSLFENAPDAIFVLDGQLRFLAVNDAGCRHLGFSREELLAVNLRELATVEHAQKIAGMFHDGSSAAWQEESPYACRDGSSIPLEVSLRRISFRGVPAILAFGRNVSERRKAARRIAFQAQLLDQVGQAVVATDTKDAITYWNKAAEALYGWNAAEVRGKPITEVIPGPAAREQMRRVLPLLRSGARWAGELEMQDRGGRVFPVHVSNAPLSDETGAIIGSVGVSRDLTEQKKAEEALRLSQEQLQQAQKMEAVGRLAGGIAHDFNNILTVITGYCELSFESAQGILRTRLQEIASAARRAAGLTAQLLAFSRKQILQPQVISPRELVTDMSAMLQRLLGEDINLCTRLEGDLWNFRADRGKVEQVIMNLAVNARDAMPEGGTLLIECANAVLDESYADTRPEVRPGRYVMIAVSDTGHGMDEKVMTHLFEPFFTTKEVGKGTGLGLSTVYGIVKQSEGHVACYSEVGRGTTFKVYLPRAAGRRTMALTGAEGDAPSVREDKLILLVEDDASLRSLTETMLRRSGYRVWSACSGAEAIEIAARGGEPIDLLLTDVVMPGMNGKEVARRVGEIHPTARVLYASGYTTDAIVRHGLLEEGIQFIQKPFTRNELLQRIWDILAPRGNAGQEGAEDPGEVAADGRWAVSNRELDSATA
ncbi:MAG TPA: PAS domain S-box protein [Spirochaetia bacterium]|nr:PAS domain S-box protein [Spirochaetia bacterium]